MPYPNIIFTKDAAEHIRSEKKKKAASFAIVIVETCKKGWSMGMGFPFEIGLVNLNQVTSDESLIICSEAMGPENIPVYLGIEVGKTLPVPTIIDYIEFKDIQLLFIPMIPKALSEYEFDPVNSSKI